MTRCCPNPFSWRVTDRALRRRRVGLANRSFVAQDADGRILFGTTREAFFSLYRLASFLERSPLPATLALNFDGGPVACQGVAINAFRRH